MYEDYLMPVQMLCCMESGINNTHPASSLLSHQTLERRATVCGVTEIDKQPTSIHCLRHEASETLTATRLYDLLFQTPFTGDLRNQRLDESSRRAQASDRTFNSVSSLILVIILIMICQVLILYIPSQYCQKGIDSVRV